MAHSYSGMPMNFTQDDLTPEHSSLLGLQLEGAEWLCWKGSLGSDVYPGRLQYSVVGLSCPSCTGTAVSLASLSSTQAVPLLLAEP